MTGNAVVTGAFSYLGRRIATKLLDGGWRVRTLTRRLDRVDVLGRRVAAAPLDFQDPGGLEGSLRGADVLFNTYWIRFDRGESSFDRAVSNTQTLFEAAKRAGVRRIAHVSIANPAAGVPLPYFAGKAAAERLLVESTVPYAIVRPTVMFGYDDVFINNIAWLIRRFPFFAVPGSGKHRLQPVHVGDVADLCVNLVEQQDSDVIDAAGRETFAFDEFVALIRDAIEARCRIVHVAPRVAYILASVVGTVVRDIVITPGELRGLMAELIVSHAQSSCPTRFSTWLEASAEQLGRKYESEIGRNYSARREVTDGRRQPIR